jgi:oligopeptide transport system substrate-binding protein
MNDDCAKRAIRRARAMPLLPVAALIAMALAATLFMAPGCGSRAVTVADQDEGEVVLRRSESEDPKSMDPHVAGDVISSRHCGMTYECLYQYDYLKYPATLIPCLASAMYHFDAETMTYTFPLRRDVYFQDDRCFHPEAQGRTYQQEGEAKQGERGKGRQFNAHDMVYSFKRFASQPDTGGYWIFEDAKVLGLEAFRNRALELFAEGPPEDQELYVRQWIVEADVPGLRAPDDFTFQVQLTRAYPQFVHAITLSYGAAVAREAAEYYRKDFFRKPVGTGPFVLESWRLNDGIVWVRNPNFREERFPTSDAPEDERYRQFMGLRLPLADRVDFRIFRESQAQWLNFRQGLLDLTGVDRDQFDAAVTAQGELTPELIARGIGLSRHAHPRLDYIAFNMNDPVVGTVAGERGRAIRRAIALCIDRRDYIRRLLNGRGRPAGQVTPPDMVGHFEDYFSPAQILDPEQGLQILREAGFIVERDGAGWITRDPDTRRQVTVTVSLRRTDDFMREFARLLRHAGARVGIRLDSELMTFTEWLKRTDDNNGQSFHGGWVMDYPDAQNMLQLLYGPNRPPGINNAAYGSAEFDALYDEMVALDQDVPEQRERKLELIRAMNAVLDKDVPWVLMENLDEVLLYNEWFVPQKPNAFAYTLIKFHHADTKTRAQKAIEWTRPRPWAGMIFLGLVLVPLGLVAARIARQA